jgi:hypothetical protein
MNLVNKKKINRDGTDYLIDINKVFYSNVGGDDHYIYEVFIYDSNIKKNSGFIKLLFKECEFNCLYEYKTYWLDYFRFNGNIDKVIKKAFERYEWNLREQKYISEKEKEWSDD